MWINEHFVPWSALHSYKIKRKKKSGKADEGKNLVRQITLKISPRNDFSNLKSVADFFNKVKQIQVLYILLFLLN